ncbi:MAG: DUF4280 domain-containing protein [Clostridiales bacterium]|nr:DUF4280 domain-containing protein [Clostridiales bacterium]
MANPVVNTAVCACSFGAAPMPLTVTSQATVQMCGQMAATIMDNQCTTFGMCSNPANPAVASAGKPVPCKPVTVAPWAPGCPTVLVCGKLLLNNTSVLTCSYGGVIQVTMTPAMTVQVP